MEERLKAGNPALNAEVVDEVVQDASDEVEIAALQDFVSPITGEIVPLTEVPDKVFSTGMMGPGFGIKIEDGEIKSPVDGKVAMIFPSKHAIGLITDSGLEVLIHIGLDTVKLDGKGFELFVEADQKVSRGDTLIKVDLPYVTENAPSTITPVIFTNEQGKEVVLIKSGHQQAGTAGIINLK